MALRRIPGIRSGVVIATQPWQWPAVVAAPAARRVFDSADDWRRLIAGRAGALDGLLRRITIEADAVILASPDLGPVLAGAELFVVCNGADDALIQAPPRPAPPEHRMVYAGTLSERFDAPFVLAALAQLPGSAELYGQCQYGGTASAPVQSSAQRSRRRAGASAGSGRSSAASWPRCSTGRAS
jgi:hypothetical protein